ncbi:MAG: hypothetical protein V1797_02230 [Pseudomonadota bacterium]
MESDRTCKRCSVTRVNALVRAYEKCHLGRDEAALPKLRQIAQLVKGRGFDGGAALLTPGLNDRALRDVCWNVSSFLNDEEVQNILGLAC